MGNNPHHLFGTILKADKVIDLFTLEHPNWGVSEISTTLYLPKTSAFQLLATLNEQGLLRQTNNNRYQLGWRMISFARNIT
ncbi:MAG: helix-turn-helix domain-containing protein [Anaerolineaceae bacterium]|jgi:DNA-binding IclR family transcriptional regulator